MINFAPFAIVQQHIGKLIATIALNPLRLYPTVHIYNLLVLMHLLGPPAVWMSHRNTDYHMERYQCVRKGSHIHAHIHMQWRVVLQNGESQFESCLLNFHDNAKLFCWCNKLSHKTPHHGSIISLILTTVLLISFSYMIHIHNSEATSIITSIIAIIFGFICEQIINIEKPRIEKV